VVGTGVGDRVGVGVSGRGPAGPAALTVDTLAACWAIDDPLARYQACRDLETLAEAWVARLADLRGRAAAEMHVDGASYAAIAALIGVSRSRAQQLVARGADVVA